ncbi:BAG family molecular chaperone regulator 5, mitochondrial-like [Phalaenopsis equestris]|uniref:BAG family molecular chaperone regulator 5, mitochondrial-like n=1 Tax=Phalaenopsis equestris TaxID=78828 RepID=UPI0009E1B1D8|nr:BAG family molecular chaperone regulator 5, mitochondrial-like [Phalaenopsis equestris]
MNSISFQFSSSSFYHLSQNDQIIPPFHPQTTSIPIDFPSNQAPIRIPVVLPISYTSAAATKIQSAYRRHLVRRQIDRIRCAAAEADRLERLIRRQDTVRRRAPAAPPRRNPRERLRISEELMAALLRLDGVPGFYAPVREIRRAVSRRIVGLQELLDAIADEPEVGEVGGIPSSLEEIVWGAWEEQWV